MNTRSTSSNLFLVATGAAVLAISVKYIDSVMVGYVRAAHALSAGQTLTYIQLLCSIVLRKAAIALVALGSHGYLVKPSPLLTGTVCDLGCTLCMSTFDPTAAARCCCLLLLLLYFTAKSTIIDPNDKNRPLTDKLVWTSLIYGCASLYSVRVGQHAMAALQLITCVKPGLSLLRQKWMGV